MMGESTVFERRGLKRKWMVAAKTVMAVSFLLLRFGDVFAESYHTWEKVEITLEAEQSYKDPYTQVEVWVDLEGPGFKKRCCGFWDGGRRFL